MRQSNPDDTKKTNSKQAYAEAIATELIERIEKGTAPWQKPWHPSKGNDLPHNHKTGETYNGGNLLKLMMEDHEDPRWLTFIQANQLGLKIKKGEKGTRCFRVNYESERVKRDENGKPVKDENGKTIKEIINPPQPRVTTFTVFNGEQIENMPELKRKPLPEPTWENQQAAEEILKASGANITHRATDRAYYSPTSDRITLPEKHQFKGAGEYYSTALHELGHWTGHSSRLNRDLSGGFGSEKYAKEELRAEISSMMLNRQLGLPHDPNRHAVYVEGWVKVLTDKPEEILAAAQDAQKIQDFVLSFRQQQSVEAKQTELEMKPETAQTQTPTPAQTLEVKPSETLKYIAQVMDRNRHRFNGIEDALENLRYIADYDYGEKAGELSIKNHTTLENYHQASFQALPELPFAQKYAAHLEYFTETMKLMDGSHFNPQGQSHQFDLNQLPQKTQSAIAEIQTALSGQRLQQVQETYLSQHSQLPAAERLGRAEREYAMEKSVAQLPPDQKIQAQTLFYETEVLNAKLRHDNPTAAPEQAEMDFER